MISTAGEVNKTDLKSAMDLRGLSGDSKPTDVPNGSTFLEMDTGKVFIFDKENLIWLEL